MKARDRRGTGEKNFAKIVLQYGESEEDFAVVFE